MDKNYYIDQIISAIQFYVIKNKTFDVGVGGVISWIFLNTELK